MQHEENPDPVGCMYGGAFDEFIPLPSHGLLQSKVHIELGESQGAGNEKLKEGKDEDVSHSRLGQDLLVVVEIFVVKVPVES